MRAGLAAALLVLWTAAAASARMPSRDEALSAAFPGAEFRQTMVFLTNAEVQEASRLAGVPVPSALIARYEAVKNGAVVGRAYLDTHVVRTKKESLLLILDPLGKLKRVEVVAFLEPPEYMPSDRWYRQFDGRDLDDDLQLQRAIHPVTGATLSGEATTAAVRRALAVDRVLQGRGEQHP